MGPTDPRTILNTNPKDQEKSKETISQLTSRSSDTSNSGQTSTETGTTSTQTTTSTDPSQLDKNYTLVLAEIFDATNSNPVGIRNANDGSNRLFIIDQRGKILVLNNISGIYQSSEFLDISNKVDYGGEKGLLGLAFHPNYPNNGFFYVNYISDEPNLHTVVSRFSVDPDSSNLALDSSEQIIITIDQPAANHNGGDIAFGPDGYLYIAMGDGGGSFDTYSNGQNLQTLLGSILRIDIDNTSVYGNYSIPSDNPFKDNSNGYKEEIFGYGMRNPWRMSFDSLTGDLWVGDVGQGIYEEVDIIKSGKNYGWPIMEGLHCINSGCNMTGLELPVHEYDHTVGNVITGGYVYRGNVVSILSGLYIFADYGSGRIWSISADTPTEPSELLFDTTINISSFGKDEYDELYVTSISGKIYVFRQVEI
jgi:glucose/arabinose dehydrogenase